MSGWETWFLSIIGVAIPISSAKQEDAEAASCSAMWDWPRMKRASISMFLSVTPWDPRSLRGYSRKMRQERVSARSRQSDAQSQQIDERGRSPSDSNGRYRAALP